MTSVDWQRISPIELPSPALAILSDPGGLWVGGLGGVARYSTSGGWASPAAGLPVTAVTALASGGGVLLAGGSGGIARSTDGGRTWEPCSVPTGAVTITAIALSPAFAEDGVALAATVEAGVLRATDGGRSWQASSFGLPSPEVSALAWGPGEHALAATAAGLARSPNGGRAWRVCAGTEGRTFAAVAFQADGGAVAAPELGPPLRASGDLSSWSPLSGLPDAFRTGAILPLPDGRLMLSSEGHGILLSSHGDSEWSSVSATRALHLTANGGDIYAGTTAGVAQSRDGGLTWTDLPPSPLHDLARLLVVDGAVLVAGTNSPLVTFRPEIGWQPFPRTPRPLVALEAAPGGALVGSTPDGLVRTEDGGESWETVLAGREGRVTRLTFLAGGTGWAGLTPDGDLLRTGDGGRTWVRLTAPFGVLPLVALQAMPNVNDAATASLVAATYDDRLRAVALWRSENGGVSWQRGGDSYTPWPIVATADSPPLVTIGTVVTVRQPDRTWRKSSIGEVGVRRVVSDGETLIALTADGLWSSVDQGESWARDDDGLPVDQLMDVALGAGVLYLLLAGGRLWSRPLSPSSRR